MTESFGFLDVPIRDLPPEWRRALQAVQGMPGDIVSPLALHSARNITHLVAYRFMDGDEVLRWFEKDNVRKAKEICDAMIVRICGRKYLGQEGQEFDNP